MTPTLTLGNFVGNSRLMREREFRDVEQSLQAGWELRGQFRRIGPASRQALPMNPTNRLATNVRPNFAKHYSYSLATRLSGDDLVFINMGYEEDPPMALPLEASDEPDWYGVQLYHRTATQVDLTGKQVLEVSCGHGDGAS
jgi:hypothetical protein